VKSFCKKKGFTLVEIMIASMLGAFIMLVAVGALRAITATSERMSGTIDAASEVRFAAGRIETDLINFYRDSNSLNCRLIGKVGEAGEGLITSLLFYAVGRTKARMDQPEGDVYEVEYYLVKEGTEAKLFRRLWPNPDKYLKPAGMLTVLAENIEQFTVRYFDGQKWQDQWSSEQMEMLPDMVEVTLMAKAPLSNDVMAKSFVVNLKRTVSATNTLEALEQAQQEQLEQESETSTTETTTDTTTGSGSQ
jgi:general secretion pathway protein J